MGHVLRIRCVPVGHGDAVLVEYGERSAPRRLLIDGGPANAYRSLRAAIAELPADQRRLDRFVVTHIDADHIDGALLLLQDDALGVACDDVWFNGWPQLAALSDTQAPDVFAPAQGEFLGAVMTERELPWNATLATPGAPIVTAGGGAPPLALDLPGGAVLRLLSPSLKELRRLRRWWQRALREAGMAPGDWQAAKERLAERKAYRPPPAEAPDVFAPKSFGSDNAVANGSSIACLLEYGGRRILLAADAYAPVVTAGLLAEARRLGVQRLPLDAVKVPHHGSVGNIDAALLDAVDCERFLVSTNGAYFGHPDAATVRLIGERKPGAELRFNYLSDTTAPWEDGAAQQAAGIAAVFPPAGEVLELDATAP